MKCLRLVLLVMLTLILGVGLTSLVFAEQLSGSFELSSKQGFSFDKSEISNSAKKADLGFYVDLNSGYGVLESAKIKYFGNHRPNTESITAQQVEKWRTNAYVSVPGSYFILKTSTNGYYLLKVDAIEEGSITGSKKLKASWEKIFIKY